MTTNTLTASPTPRPRPVPDAPLVHRPECAYRVRLRSARHPYGHLLWAWEVYNPRWPRGRQVVASGSWQPSWDAARREGLRHLGYRQYRPRVVMGLPA